MIPYYADERKYIFNTRNPLIKSLVDKRGDQMVSISGTICGTMIRPDKAWTPFCEKLFRNFGATRVCLHEISAAPDSSLSFVNDLPGCKSLAIESGKKVDLFPLAGNACLEDLQLYPHAQYKPFDLTTLPNLARCQVPLRPEFNSFLKCTKLVSLCLGGGRHDGVLNLESLRSLEEFICIGVSKLKKVVFHSKARLRSVEFQDMREFESAEPLEAITRDLRVVELSGVPRMKLEWLKHARKADCIALRLGEIPSIRFLAGLKDLRVLDLFGSKVKDGDLSFRDSLKNEIDGKLWSAREP